jgi:general secretion pathway protein E
MTPEHCCMAPTLLLADAVSAHLIGWWMALLMYATFLPWAWLVATRLDKDARYYHLKRHMWNGIHLAAGVLALLAMLLIPVVGVSWLVGVIILLAPLLAYWRVRNQNVPESARFFLSKALYGTRAAERRKARAAREAVLRFADSKGDNRPAPTKEDPRAGVWTLAEDVIGPALERRASRIELTVAPSGGQVTHSIDGVRYKGPTVAADAGVALIDFLKELAGADVSDRRRRQTGDFTVITPDGPNEVGLTTTGSSAGQVLRLDFNRSQRMGRPFDGLGFLPSQAEALRKYVEPHERHGIILVGAPPEHGLSTTLYSLLGRHDAYTANIKTLEYDIESRLDGVDHQQFDPNNRDVDFATALQSILRRDPDIVMVGRIRDAETARVATEPGLKGPLIYVGQQSPSIAEMIRDWVRLLGDVKGAAKVLRAATNQRLLRALCPHCRQPFQPSAEQLRKLNLPADKARQIYRAGGKVQIKNKIEECPVCRGTGYLGLTAAMEVFDIDEEARRILSTGDLKGALAHARRNKMVYLQEAALAKVIAGETTLEELVRATAPPARSEAAQPAPTVA